jgi:ribosomal protein S12 methylthiotransferase
VLVEGHANEEQLRQANVSSWEHGLVREAETLNPSAFASGYGATAPKRSEGGQPSTLNYLIARGEADAPDIDGRVYVRGKLPIGEFAQVKIVGHTDYDLIAEPV